ncbi:MAG TPA: pyrimidine 5'-nucleotidase [Anaerolineae bacterium]|nr:pyrimidine 5'-nucleotidase [Anaerolineae bacterium]
MFKYLIFDLDETLYPRQTGLMQEIGVRINRYLIENLHLPPEQANELRKRYYNQHGTALRGLVVERPDVDPEDYLHFVHDIRLSDYIGPNPALAEMLRSLPLTKVIFTNATVEHAQNVLNILGVADQFADIIDVRRVEYVSKPNAEAYQRLLNILHTRGDACILIEDAARNLLPGKGLGMTTILVDSDDCAQVDYCVHDILAVKQIVDSLLATNNPQPTTHYQ